MLIDTRSSPRAPDPLAPPSSGDMVATSVANLAALPLPTLIGGILVVALAAAVFVRATANLRRGNSPPVEEGVPFVGGLLKFSKVRP